MLRSPLITGVGLATPLGDTLASTWASLLRGATIATHSRVPEIEQSGRARVDRLAHHVALEALSQSRWNRMQQAEAALIVGTSKGPADEWLASFPPASAPRPFAYGLAQTAAFLGEELGITGPRLTLSSACSSGIHALIRAVMMVRAGEVNRALVVAAESSLHPLFIGSFKRLGVIAPDGFGCRPFDRDRAGFVVGEAAAAVCIEVEDRAGIVVEEFALGADATHLTSSDPRGQTLKRIIRRAIGTESVDLIHAHGTGTMANDADELKAIETAVDQPRPPVLYSHKAAIGHTLGAAGLAAVAINCRIHETGIVPPNANTLAPLPTTRVTLSARRQECSVKRSIAIAAGFGGAVAAVRMVSR